MKVTTVSAAVRLSQEAKGGWRTIELGAEATLTNSDETLEHHSRSYTPGCPAN
jgi:hypothetical protein